MFGLLITFALVLAPLLANAAVLSSSPTEDLFNGLDPHSALTTPPPSLLGAVELRKRRDGQSTNCGYYNGNTFACSNSNAFCAATILSGRHAYQYCGTSGAATQPIFTTYYGNWSTKVDCPPSAGCWYVCSVLCNRLINSILTSIVTRLLPV